MNLEQVLSNKPPYPYCSKKSRSFSGNILVWTKEDPTWRLYDLGKKEISLEKKEEKSRKDTTEQGPTGLETESSSPG